MHLKDAIAGVWLKLLDQVMKVVERVIDSIICQHVSIDEMQFVFLAGKGTTDATFIVDSLKRSVWMLEIIWKTSGSSLEKGFEQGHKGYRMVDDMESLSGEVGHPACAVHVQGNRE